MVQLALGALAKVVGGAAASGAGASAAAAGTGLGSFLTGSTGLSILSGVATVGSALSSLAGGKQEAAGLRMQADQANFDARQEEVEGVRRTTKLKRALLQALGENDVAYAASGIDLGSGVAEDNRANAEKLAATEISIDRSTTEARAAMYRSRAASFTRLASSAESSSLLKALGIGAEGGLRLLQRG
ncbi:hypothetical protein [Kaistia sp. MMO-174]|uniref:hypothetical protein n=1 Tax=Kaistia sp. MMO-174 TaxID=3081256 RepID=UPI00301AF79D